MAKLAKSQAKSKPVNKPLKPKAKGTVAAKTSVVANQKKLKLVSSAAPEKTQAQPEKKKMSDKLLATLEKRRETQQSAAAPGGKPQMFGRAPGRRGRRPKGMSEYTPTHQEEGNDYGFEGDSEGIEYDTGIRVQKSGGEDRGLGLERFEEFDEELNFDW